MYENANAVKIFAQFEATNTQTDSLCLKLFVKQ